MTAISLTRYGYDCVILERHARRLGQPKAHVINSRTAEIFRQNGIEITALRGHGLPSQDANVVKFVSSLTGIELGVIDIRSDEDVEGLITPETSFNVPQPFLEEHLLRIALATGKVLYLRRHEWRGCVQETDQTINSEVRSRDTDTTEYIRSKYLIGCDGAKSRTRDALQIAFEPLNPGSPVTLHYASVHFSADLSHLKPGLLWFVLDPAGMGVFIAYNHQNSWVYFLGYDPAITPKETFTSECFKSLVFKAVGEPLKDYRELGITLWTTNPQLAKSYRSPKIPRAFLAGDAAHTFPPTGGLGVNTGIADVQNLTWKIHAVESGWATESFLNTVSTERLVIAKDNCKQSRLNEEKIFRLVSAVSKPGVTAEGLYSDPASRQRIEAAIADNRDHFSSLNLQLGYVYGRDHIRGPSDYQKESVPGARLPHSWLKSADRKISSLDLVDGLGFVLITPQEFTGKEHLEFNGVPISVKQLDRDFVDTDGEWSNLLSLNQQNAVLVRPDQHIVGTVKTIAEAGKLLNSYLQLTIVGLGFLGHNWGPDDAELRTKCTDPEHADPSKYTKKHGRMCLLSSEKDQVLREQSLHELCGSKKRARPENSLEERLASLEQRIQRDSSRFVTNPSVSAPNINDRFAIQQLSPELSRSSLTSRTALTPTVLRSVVPPRETGTPSASSLNAASMFEHQDCASASASFPENPTQILFSRRAIDHVASSAQRERSFVCIDQGVELGHENCQTKQNDQNEHHGRASFLSICSPAGVEWVCGQLGNSNFRHSAARLALFVTRRLKMTKPLGVERMPDPDYQTALKWTAGQCVVLNSINAPSKAHANSAFFDESFEHSLGLVPRRAFEARLHQHYRHQLTQNDLTWYALRNTVFAVGSRLVALPAGQPSTFAASEKLSWLYFENALSAHTNLVYMPSDISVVETLAYFCEAISCPNLEYMLLAVAVGLGQSKGLHLHPPAQCNLVESEKATRIWLWWIMYIYDKHLASRSGRPSMIRDEDISLALPTEVRPDTRSDLKFMLSTIKHAQISSSIERCLFSTESKSKSLDGLRDAVVQLDNELRSWNADLGAEYRMPTTNKPELAHARISLIHILYLHNCFHGSLCILHTVMTQPWKNSRFQYSRNPVHAAQVQESSRIVAEAARSIILQSQQCEINATSPSWLVFYYPLLGAIHLFVHILRAPTSPSALSDIALIDVAAGNFARLEYATSGRLVITFVRELAVFARLLVSPPRYRQPGVFLGSSLEEPTQPLEGANDMPIDGLAEFDITDFGCYEWPLFSSPLL
ncbi:hypothetical protein PISL3812_03438 [Talaromyces islandicus]|uniref:Xylanolytic transcriptional activator regulatory domain-containing protein n=1 Tax=Talaromyces islandicus TaxID=28573 RepID=A0A0U1LTK0_TALIS|nr:hypothetical protein PISL3812_03438 [Talaromyces islandicus]